MQIRQLAYHDEVYSPTCDYECVECSQRTELFRPITAKSNRKLFCEKCGRKVRVKRLIGSGGGVIFKGSGFYATDYREKPKKSEKDDDK